MGTRAMFSAVLLLSLRLAPAAGSTAEPPGLVMVTHSPPAVSLPRQTTAGQPGRYGLGFPLQLGPTTAALLANVRTIGEGRWDYEDGTDAFVFDDLRAVARGGPLVLSRNEHEQDAETGRNRVIVKFPVSAGFWPLGAKRADGSPHPGAGTGFGFCQALSFEDKGGGFFTWDQRFRPYVEVLQLAFDGRALRVTGRELIRSEELWQTRDHWGIRAPGLLTAIPDGDDLLLALSAEREEGKAGVCRFRFSDGRWRPASFTPVADGSEPSLVRATDGSLVFGVRGRGSQANALQAWHSADGGRTWMRTLEVGKARTEAPVSLLTAADGTVLVAANALGTRRTRLQCWELLGEMTRVGEPRLIRDCDQEFGVAAEGMFWAVDHPSSATVRLADGQWHGLLCYRVLAFPTRGKAETVVPQTGCYLEELLGSGPPLPTWRF